MKLYHGTTENIARKAIQDGLKPRKVTGSVGNWEHNNMASRADCVYLTTAYAGHFARCATEPNERWGIVEIDSENLQPWLFRPDEDFLEQGSRGEREEMEHLMGDAAHGDVETRTHWFRDNIDLFAHLWEMSIEHLGNCSFKGSIHPGAITRVAIFDPRSNPMISTGIDPTISLLNYKIIGSKYRNVTRWLVGEDITAEEYMTFYNPDDPIMRDQRQIVIEELQKRDGLQVIEVAS